MIGLGSDFCGQQLHLSGIPFNETKIYLKGSTNYTRIFNSILNFSSKKITTGTALKVQKKYLS